jgi:hypothetical protein
MESGDGIRSLGPTAARQTADRMVDVCPRSLTVAGAIQILTTRLRSSGPTGVQSPAGDCRRRKVSVIFTIETEQEVDDRWLAEVLELPGVVAYGSTSDEAVARAQARPCAWWPTGSRTTKRTASSLSPSTRRSRDPVAEHSSSAGARGVAPQRMVD